MEFLCVMYISGLAISYRNRQGRDCHSRKTAEKLSICCLMTKVKKRPYFVKIVFLKNDNCALALRKCLFCDAKQPLLSCKTYAFGTQNNRFCRVLIIRWLDGFYVCEKYLHFFYQLLLIERGM